ncbi:hypothetical protein Vi05172_g11604 [Venturia inaequalis]|nr:hypothetical protein Vi05172_g11604 [Venturia inaequalis]
MSVAVPGKARKGGKKVPAKQAKKAKGKASAVQLKKEEAIATGSKLEPKPTAIDENECPVLQQQTDGLTEAVNHLPENAPAESLSKSQVKKKQNELKKVSKSENSKKATSLKAENDETGKAQDNNKADSEIIDETGSSPATAGSQAPVEGYPFRHDFGDEYPAGLDRRGQEAFASGPGGRAEGLEVVDEGYRADDEEEEADGEVEGGKASVEETAPGKKEQLASSYKRYKQDTNVFITWLSEAAQACGWNPPAQLEYLVETPASSSAPSAISSSKKTGRKNHKKVDETRASLGLSGSPTICKIPVQEIVRQVEIIAGSGQKSICMPPSVTRILRRAITARKQCAAWFQTTDTSNSLANDSHQYFIDVLEKAASDIAAEPDHRSSPISKDGPKDILTSTQNYYSSLASGQSHDIEDSDIAMSQLAIDDMHMTMYKASDVAGDVKSRRTIYQAEEDAQSALAFKIYCFFEDLHILREELKRIWTSYKDGKMSIIGATIITTAVIELVSRTEKELIESHPDWSLEAPQQTYFTLASKIFNSEHLHRGNDTSSRNQVSTDRTTSDQEEFMFFPTGSTLIKLSMLSGHSRSLAFLDTQKLDREARVLCQMIMELGLMHKLKRDFKGMNRSAKKVRFGRETADTTLFNDIFAAVVCKVWKDGIVEVNAVFASRVLLDTIDILGDTFEGRKMILDEATHCEETFQKLIGYDEIAFPAPEDDSIRNFRRRVDIDFDPIFPKMRMAELAKFDLSSNTFETPAVYGKNNVSNFIENDGQIPSTAMIQTLAEQLETTDLTNSVSPEKFTNSASGTYATPILPDENDHHFYTNHNPFQVGTLILNLQTLEDEMGTTIANENHVLFGTCHLYNALKQLKLTDLEWPELETIMRLHSHPLFANEIPKTPEAMAKRAYFRNGSGVSEAAFNKKMSMTFPSSTTTQILRPFFEGDPLGRSMYLLEEKVREAEQRKGASALETCGGTMGHRKRVISSEPTPLQYIARLEEHVPALMAEVQIDYISTTILCYKILRGVHDVMVAKYAYPVSSTMMDNGMGLSHMVATLLERTYQFQRMGRGKFDWGIYMNAARDVFEETLEDYLEDEDDYGGGDE